MQPPFLRWFFSLKKLLYGIGIAALNSCCVSPFCFRMALMFRVSKIISTFVLKFLFYERRNNNRSKN